MKALDGHVRHRPVTFADVLDEEMRYPSCRWTVTRTHRPSESCHTVQSTYVQASGTFVRRVYRLNNRPRVRTMKLVIRFDQLMPQISLRQKRWKALNIHSCLE